MLNEGTDETRAGQAREPAAVLARERDGQQPESRATSRPCTVRDGRYAERPAPCRRVGERRKADRETIGEVASFEIAVSSAVSVVSRAR